MCLAIPSKVIKIEGNWVETESNNCHNHVSISLLKNKQVAIGDYLLVHGDLAIQKLESEEAEKILELIQNGKY